LIYILSPVCAANFSEEEWMKIYSDSKDYAPCLGVERKTWHDAENYSESLPEHQGEVIMPGGHLTINQLTVRLNTIPMEITFVEGDNINRFSLMRVRRCSIVRKWLSTEKFSHVIHQR
jgi:DUF438 domain-containing protein